MFFSFNGNSKITSIFVRGYHIRLVQGYNITQNKTLWSYTITKGMKITAYTGLQFPYAVTALKNAMKHLEGF